MALDAETKDCTQLTDTEMAEMADICVEAESRYEAGLLSKQAEEWVLVTLVREGKNLRGFSFSTLERIGGTPSIVLGLAFVKRTARRDSVLNAVMKENYRRALMAFPDEDVLVGTKFNRPEGFDALKALTDIIPTPGHKASGEERAWGRRLTKRFGLDAGYDDKKFVAKGDGSFPLVLDHETLKPDSLDPDVVALFDVLEHARGDCIVAHGWMMAEKLLKYGE